MNREQTADLLDLLAAANVLNRFEDSTPDVWQAALGDLDYPDCMQAAAHLVRTQQWVKIADVRAAVRTIRNARLAATNAVYDGNPDESWPEAIHNQRALTRAAAAGRLPPQPAKAAIESGRGVDATGRGRAILRAVGRESASRRPELAAPCPYCGAAAGKPCRSGRGHKRRDPHDSRIDASRLLRSGQQPPTREELERETERRAAAARDRLARLVPQERAQLAEHLRGLHAAEQANPGEGEAS